MSSGEQMIMFKDKYSSIFSCKKGSYCVCYLWNIFRNARSF